MRLLLFSLPGDAEEEEEEIFDDMKGHGVTFQSITHLFLPLAMHTCMNVTGAAHR